MHPEMAVLPDPTAMTAHGVLRCEYVDGRNTITRMRSEGQFVLRPTHPKAFEPWTNRSPSAARVSISAGTAGPLGGDHLSMDVHVGPGATLVLNDISATLALPGNHGERSEMTCRIRIEDGGTLVWMPEPVIAARGCDHQQRILVDLDAGSRFYMREELIIGRHNEEPGNIEQRVRISRSGHAVYDQNLQLGSRYAGWNSPSVTSSAKAVGTMIIVDPGTEIGAERSDLINADTVSVGLEPDVVQTTAVAATSLELSRALDAAASLIGPPWGKLRG